jgi:regulatory protein
MTPAIVSVYNIPMEKDSSRPSRPQSSARNKMMDHLARRDHSEKELREKLKDQFSPEEIERAVQYGKDHGFLPNSEESLQAQAEKAAADLKRRGKGPLFISNYLEEKGLPCVNVDSDEELEKARELAHNKFSNIDTMDRKDKAKVARFLISRGFDEETVRKVIYE